MSARRGDTTPERRPASGVDRGADEERWSAWMVAAQAGDAEGYRKLLGELDGVLRAYLRRLLGDAALVEDCVQEALLAIHKARHTYDASRPFRPWMFALARYKTVDVVRRRGTVSRREVPEASQAIEAGHSPGESTDAQLDVARVLSSLDAPQREALTLTKLTGHSIDEAARIAGVSQTAMKSRVHRALRQLRKQLATEWK